MTKYARLTGQTMESGSTLSFVQRWMNTPPEDMARGRYWERNTDMIRALYADLTAPGADPDKVGGMFHEIYDAVHYLGLDSYWWDWCKGHDPDLASRIEIERSSGRPYWLPDLYRERDAFFYQDPTYTVGQEQ